MRHINMDDERYIPDFFSEFLNEADSVVGKYIGRFGHMMSFDDCDLSDAVRMLLRQHFRGEADYYVRSRRVGKTVEESLSRLARCVGLFTDESASPVSEDSQITLIEQHPWEKVLREYEGAFIIHIHDESQIDRILSLEVSEDTTVVLVCDTELPDETELPDNFAVLTLGWSDIRSCDNQFLETNFPYVYHCANAMEWIIRIIRPSCVTSFADTSVSGCIMSAIAKKHGTGYE